VCREHIALLNDVSKRLAEAEEEAARRTSASPKERYPAPTAAGRRALAADDNNLMLEMPTWGEDLTMSDEKFLKSGLSPDERQRLEQAYGHFHRSVLEGLQKLYAEMTGDPNAGADATIGALVHSVMDLAPKQACRDRMLALVAALASGQPLGPPSPDANACELAAVLIFAAVDSLEAEVESSLGQKGLDALWSGVSSFNFSVEPD